jgi:hypothetical protein
MSFVGVAVVGGAFAVGSQVYKGVQGHRQQKKGEELARNNVRPDYNIPTAATESLNNARTLAAMNRMPGQDQMEANLGQNSAQAISNVRDYAGGGAGAMAAVAGINQNQNQATADLGIQAANFKFDNQRNLQSSLNQYSDFQEKKWQWNKANPYLERAAAARAMIGAGQQNKMSAVDGIGAMGMQAATLGMENYVPKAKPTNPAGTGG